MQIEVDEDDDRALLKLTGSIALLLVESNENIWRKHLKRESVKWVTHVWAIKETCGAVKEALKAQKKL